MGGARVGSRLFGRPSPVWRANRGRIRSTEMRRADLRPSGSRKGGSHGQPPTTLPTRSNRRTSRHSTVDVICAPIPADDCLGWSLFLRSSAFWLGLPKSHLGELSVNLRVSLGSGLLMITGDAPKGSRPSGDICREPHIDHCSYCCRDICGGSERGVGRRVSSRRQARHQSRLNMLRTLHAWPALEGRTTPSRTHFPAPSAGATNRKN